MKRLLAISLLFGMGFTAGCKQQPKEELAGVPGPPDAGAELTQDQPPQVQLLEPVAIEPVTPIQPQPVAPPQVHIVQKGDTFWSIAKRYYGDGQRSADIMAANPGLIPEKLPVGQEIVLP